MRGRAQTPECDPPGAVPDGEQLAVAAERDRIDKRRSGPARNARQRRELRVAESVEHDRVVALVGDRQAMPVVTQRERRLTRPADQPRRHLPGGGVEERRVRLGRLREAIGDERELHRQRGVAALEVAGLERNEPRDRRVSFVLGAVMLTRGESGEHGHPDGEHDQSADEPLRVWATAGDHGGAHVRRRCRWR
jgi:hypothetical protein